MRGDGTAHPNPGDDPLSHHLYPAYQCIYRCNVRRVDCCYIWSHENRQCTGRAECVRVAHRKVKRDHVFDLVAAPLVCLDIRAIVFPNLNVHLPNGEASDCLQKAVRTIIAFSNLTAIRVDEKHCDAPDESR